MATKRKNVDVLSVDLTFTEGNNYSFADILRTANERTYSYAGKESTLRILNTELENCILAIIETIQSTDIAPKANKRTREMFPVNVDANTEGLAYANILLYDTERKVLIYEINKNGCYPKKLKEHLELCWNNSDEETPNVEIHFPVIFKQDEYQRMLNLNRYKKISVKMYNPTELISCYNEVDDSIYNNTIKQSINAGVVSNANSIVIEQIAFEKRSNPLGLSRTFIRGVVDSILTEVIGRGNRMNIDRIQVEGYAEDPEGGRRKGSRTIDLIGDTFKEYFRITDITIQQDLQISDRKSGVEGLYSQILPELRAIR